MSSTSYEFYKNKFNNTVPIRGRSVEVRPLGKRRRDWEQVTRKDLGDGQFSYCAKLYNTECVEYLPNGDVILRTDNWQTPSTAEFIHTHSPFTCFKQNRKLWVRSRDGEREVKVYPLTDDSLRFRWVAGHDYVPHAPVVIKKRVIDRAKAKAAREPLQPFLQWARVFLAMSDGWVMHETRKQVLGWDDEKKEFLAGWIKPDKSAYGKLCNASDFDDPETVYIEVLCRLATDCFQERRVADTIEIEYMWNGMPLKSRRKFLDFQVSYDSLKRRVHGWVEKFEDIHKIIEVEPSAKTMSNVV